MKRFYFLITTLILFTFNLSACSDYELEDYGAVGPERNCKDKVDNDGDGKIDCADTDCATAANCTGGDPETNCTDKIDNDNDGAVDCADADCNDHTACQPEPKCGNGIKENGEGCDGQDFGERNCVSYGFTGGSLTCTSACLVSVASCSNNAEPICGNGIKEAGEQCDRNDFNGRTCSFYGYDSGSLSCSSGCVISVSGCYNSSNSENCSNGQDDDGDGFIDCDDADCWLQSACQVAYCGDGVCNGSETKVTCPADCPNTVVCGNGVKEAGEVCDGNAFGGLSCASYGFNYGSLLCTNSCSTISTVNCYNSSNGYCGNGVKEAGEVCDGNAFGGLSCASYGFNYGSLLCTNSCSTISTVNCYNSSTGYCGNGVKEAGEVCDGNAFGGLTCSSYGFTYGTLSCTNSCGTISTVNCYNSSTGYCGNGVKDSGEVCDGNAFGGLSCASYGFNYGSLLCTNSCSTISTVNCYDNNSSRCGNGILESGEQCDSNTFPSGLGCDDYGFNSGYLSCSTGCTVSTASCYNPSTYYCGNGVLNSGEGCDGSYFGGKTCSTFGFSGGNLTCNYNCTVNTTGCTLVGGEICTNGIDDDGDGALDCSDSDCRWQASCTYLTVRKRTATGLNVTYFGCDGTNNASWDAYQCSGTAVMFNGAVNGRYMFAYTTSTCSPQAILDYGISWEAFEFFTSSTTVNMACYVGCSINPQTNLQTQANAVCILDKTNPAHQAERNAYLPNGKWLEVYPGSIASYLYWWY